MSKKDTRLKHGFTMVELMVTLVISLVIFCSISVMVVDGSRWFSDNYNKVNSQPAVESLTARKTFERIIRQASSQNYWVSADAIEVNYSSAPNSPIDSYAQFYLDGDNLMLETGTLNPKTSLTSTTVSSNVASCQFIAAGSSAQMILVLDDGNYRRGAVTSAVMHNE